MDIRKIKKLIDLLEESGIAELEIKEGEESVRLSRGVQALPTPMPAALSAPAPAPIIPEASAEPTAPAAEQNPEPEGSAIESPMVGTYYEAPAPGTDPFVKLGQRVNVGDTLCIIEAMKILNQIESDKAGEIKAILHKNGEPVEYGEKLFIVG